MLPFLVGLILAERIEKRPKWIHSVMNFLFWIVVLGIIIQLFVPYPWVGLHYMIGGKEISTARKWSEVNLGINRISGFTRNSVMASIQVYLLLIFTTIYNKNNNKKIIYWIFAFIAILLTTNKTMWVVYLFGLFSICIVYLFKNGDFFLKRSLILLAVILILLPLVIGPIITTINIPVYIHLLFNSFLARVEIGWPEAFALIANKGSLLLGRGIGGIATATEYFEPNAYNPADNLFVYLYALFGVNAFFILSIIVIKAQNLDLRVYKSHYFSFLVLEAALLFGFMTSVLEYPIFLFFIGVAVSTIFSSTKKKFSIFKLVSVSNK